MAITGPAAIAIPHIDKNYYILKNWIINSILWQKKKWEKDEKKEKKKRQSMIYKKRERKKEREREYPNKINKRE